jgi:quinol monooxygenase YgiN
MIIVTGSIIARKDSFDAVLKLSREHVERSRNEDGCISHDVHVDTENPLRLFFFERWRDEPALRAHFAVPASREFVKGLRDLIVETTGTQIWRAEQIER